MSKIAFTDLITEGNRVTGAYAIDMISGEALLFKAKAFILACGNQNFKVMRMWSSGRGDGMAAAYRAGAKFRNAEFGSFINIIQSCSKMVSYSAENYIFNAKGESVSTRKELAEGLNIVVGGVDIGGAQSMMMYMDVRDGKGPIYEDTVANQFYGSEHGRNMYGFGTPDPDKRRPYAEQFWGSSGIKNRVGGEQHGRYKEQGRYKEVVPGLIGEFSPLYVDHDMSSSLEGLYASGDICANGSA